MKFEPILCSSNLYSEYIDLFTKCFPASKKFTCEYLDWLYRCNPDGEVVGYDARDGDRIAAHYACIPARALVGDQEVKVLLSLNTATHPDYQGKGLFTKLAELTYAAGLAQGYDCVYGVANANSTPGFIRKLNFQLLGPLRAMIGVGPLGIDFSRIKKIQFQRTWSSESLAWRCASPVNPVLAHLSGDRGIFLAPAMRGRGCMAVAEICNIPYVIQSSYVVASPLRLFLGLVPVTAQRLALYTEIPTRLRPSPLNLIYRSLSSREMAIDLDSIFFNFLDFDAY